MSRWHREHPELAEEGVDPWDDETGALEILAEELGDEQRSEAQREGVTTPKKRVEEDPDPHAG